MCESELPSRSVKFSSELTTTINYLDEPPNLFTNVIPSEIIEHYKTSSYRYNCKPIATVLQQLSVLSPNKDRFDNLNLSNLRLNLNQCEAMEEIFRRARFQSICMDGVTFDEEGAVSLFEIFKYYDSAGKISMCSAKGLGTRAWIGLMKMLRGSTCIGQIDLSGVNLDSGGLLYLSRAFRFGAEVSVLRLQNTNMNGPNLNELVNGLRNNMSIRELYLGSNSIGLDEVAYLRYMLGGQLRLRLIDLSNNELKDNGLISLVTGLHDIACVSLAHLHVSKNGITAKSMPSLATFLIDSRLKCVVLSNNPIGDEGLALLKPGLFKCSRLVRLELRNCCQITEGVIALSEFLAESKTISQIDLRGNNLKAAAFFALICSLRLNRSLRQLLLDSYRVNNGEFEDSEAVDLIEKLLERNRTELNGEKEETNSVLSYETSSLLEYSGALAAVTSTGNFIVSASSKVFRSIKGLLFGNKSQSKSSCVEEDESSLEFGSVEMQLDDSFSEECNGHLED